jgi:putative ABC transport system ATP-binding protein
MPGTGRPREGAVGLALTNVNKAYQAGENNVLRALRDIDLTIEAGESVALAGPSGSGKSTLLHLVGAIDRPDTGRIVASGVDLTGLSRRALADYRSTIGFVFQRFHLLPAFTAIDNVLAPLVSRRVAFDKHERALALLEAVGLGGRERALPSQLSGGQQQRVAIARSLINNPGLLLADEPTGSLDSHTAERVLTLLGALRATHRFTLLVATHDPAVAATCDRTIALRDGALSREPASSA